MMYDTLVVDTSNLYMRAYSVGSSLTSQLSDGTEIITGGIYNFIRMINSLENRFLKESNGKVYFIFDNSKSGILRRKDIDPEYKSNRTKKDDLFYRTIDFLHSILLNYREGWFCVKCEGYEADDLVAPIVDTLKGEEVLLVSNDMDWMRSISEHVHVAKYEDKDYKVFTPELFAERFGFSPSKESVILYKSIRGDHSDNIPPSVKGIPEKAVMEIVGKCSSVRELLHVIRDENPFENLSETFRTKIKESIPRLTMNEKLVGFQDISEENLREGIYNCTFHPSALRVLYKELGFQISKLDPRILKFIDETEKPVTPSDFFKPRKIKRS